MSRDIRNVIDAIRSNIPSDRTAFLSNLDSIYSSAGYAAPESVQLGWQRLMYEMQCEIGEYPTEEWEYIVCSLVSTISVEKLKIMVAETLEDM